MGFEVRSSKYQGILTAVKSSGTGANCTAWHPVELPTQLNFARRHRSLRNQATIQNVNP